MSVNFNWDKLPQDMRLGTNPDDIVTLYRGFTPQQLHPERGMLSSAVAMGNLESVLDVIDAVEKEDVVRLMGHISTHAGSSDYARTGILTPVVSS